LTQEQLVILPNEWGKIRGLCSKVVPHKVAQISLTTVRTVRRAERDISKLRLHVRNTQSELKSQNTAHHFFCVTRGQTSGGFVAQVGNNFTTTDALGRELGAFECFKAEAVAVSKTCEAAL
jgi:hypothetical protein